MRLPRNVAWTVMAAMFVALLMLCLFTGTVDIPPADTFRVLTGGEATKTTWTHIITELRVPAVVAAALAGAALGVSGLLLQTTFNNPLAGPSILGVSTGASLGVAVMLLAFTTAMSATAASLVGALVGAVTVIGVLLVFSSFVRSSTMLLIVGIMLGYLASSAVSLLSFYATQEGVHSYVIWGLGSFSGVGRDDMALFSILTIALLMASMLLVKPLNAFLMGEEYAANVGINVRASRNTILFVSGALTAIVTAYCGPIGFIGLAVPHIARMLLQTSNHRALLPAVVLTGAVTGLLTLWISTLPGGRGTLPVNSITPFIGVPVVLYIILNRRRRL